MSSQDIKETIEQLTASGKAYVVATVVRTEAPSSTKAGDRAVLDEDGILAGWVGGGCAKPAVTSNAVDALRDGQTRLIRISRDLDGLESGIIGYPMTCQSSGTLDIFIHPIMPKPLLVVIGQTAIAQALCTLAAGAGLFVRFEVVGGSAPDRTDEIVITPGLARHIAEVWQKTRQRPPTPSELEGLINEYVREEILYREALAMGLDRDDVIVRRRMRQKIEFLSEDIAKLTVPDEDELKAFLATHPETYRNSNSYSFRPV